MEEPTEELFCPEAGSGHVVRASNAPCLLPRKGPKRSLLSGRSTCDVLSLCGQRVVGLCEPRQHSGLSAFRVSTGRALRTRL